VNKMAKVTLDIPDHVVMGDVAKATFEYHALNGQVFTKEAWYYEASEALSELSQLAYENDTAMHFIVIH
jgi:hypothetical protein